MPCRRPCIQLCIIRGSLERVIGEYYNQGDAYDAAERSVPKGQSRKVAFIIRNLQADGAITNRFTLQRQGLEVKRV